MTNKIKRLEQLYKENETAFKAMIANTWGTDINVLSIVRNAIVKAGIDESIYKFMEDDILKGNFSVIYLDNRIVGADKKRLQAQQQLERLRTTLFKMKQEGITVFEILFEK